MSAGNIMLDEKTKQKIVEILSADKTAEVGIRNGKIIVWEVSSKKKYETAVTSR